MTAGTVRTAPRPRTWAISTWAGTARPTTAWSPSPRRGPMSGCITRSPGWPAAGRRGGGDAAAARRVVVAPADPAARPPKAPWSLVTTLPRPGGPREPESPHPAATLTEITRIYGIRNWIEQGYKQVKDELGWADFQVRSDTAIRRHQALVNCAFSFCWDAWFAATPPQHEPAPPRPEPGRGERGAARRLTPAGSVLATCAARDTRLPHPLHRPAALVPGMVGQAPAAAAASPDELRRGRPRPASLHPELTNYY